MIQEAGLWYQQAATFEVYRRRRPREMLNTVSPGRTKHYRESSGQTTGRWLLQSLGNIKDRWTRGRRPQSCNSDEKRAVRLCLLPWYPLPSTISIEAPPLYQDSFTISPVTVRECRNHPRPRPSYLRGMKREECVAPIPGRPCLTGLLRRGSAAVLVLDQGVRPTMR